jgi:hypothetical protein
MHVQAPTLSRTPLMLGAAGLASAAIAAGAIAIINNNDSSTPTVAPSKPSVVQVSKDRVWDGSAILRGTEKTAVVTPRKAVPVSPQRVWDGSPILRGTEPSPLRARQQNTFRHSGGPSVVPRSGSDLGGFAARRPEGFHGQP